MATSLLYHRDPLLLVFDAAVTGHAMFNGAPSVILDQSAFYPEAGGQMADRGLLAGRRVLDVQIDDAGNVHHLLEPGWVDNTAGDNEPLLIGTRVSGAVDRSRRRAHMALHTAQHALSRALVELASGETVSSRLGETECTIDLDLAKLDEGLLARAEDLVNSVIDDDLPIRAWFPDADELKALPLRRAPKVSENIRVVDIGGFDVSPCGGTHCTRSSQMGLLRVQGLERAKGKMRVKFAAGPRARGELGKSDEILRGLARELTCGAGEVPVALEKLRRDLSESRAQAKRIGSELAARMASELIAQARASGSSRIVASFEGLPAEMLRSIGAQLSSAPELAMLLASRNESGTSVLAVRGAASSFDCGAFVKQIAAASGGRGGGRPDRAEGTLPRELDWAALCAAAIR